MEIEIKEEFESKETADLIKANDSCIFRINETRYLITKVSPTTYVITIQWKAVILIAREARISKKYKNVSLAPIVGHPWGSCFQIVDNKLVRTKNSFTGQLLDKVTVSNNLESAVGGKDNRNVKVNDESVQELSQEKIEEMKKSGQSGDTIIEALITNSQTFQQRTEMGKEKYLKKKMEKYLVIIEVMRPTALMLIRTYFSKSPQKICQMRMDSLGIILTKSNINAMGKSVMIYEETSGLMTGAVAERMSGNGNIIHFYNGHPNINAVQYFGFTSKESEIILSASFDELYKVRSGQKILNKPLEEFVKVTPSVQVLLQKKKVRLENVLKETTGNGFDSLIIVKAHDALSTLKLLFPFLKPGRTFCIFSPYLETLVLCHEAIKQSNSGIFIEFAESWLREYQIKPNRCHPLNQMSGASGYILSGIKLSGGRLGVGYLEQYLNAGNQIKKMKVNDKSSPSALVNNTNETEEEMKVENLPTDAIDI